MDKSVERTLEELGARFDAALDNEEEEAAADLAFSFRQDRNLPEAVASAAVDARTSSDLAGQVSEVGEDFFSLREGVLLPFRAAVFVSGSGKPPRRNGSDLLEVLRRWARSGAKVEVDTVAGAWRGRLDYVAADHLAIVYSGERRVFIPKEGLVSIRLTRAG